MIIKKKKRMLCSQLGFFPACFKINSFQGVLLTNVSIMITLASMLTSYLNALYSSVEEIN